MYHFRYDPKGAKTLPYYDKFPLIFMVGPAAGGFYGINLHYLPPQLRAKLMDSLYDITNSASKYKFFKPTFKHYLSSQVKSEFIEINSTEWDTALFLPTERFEKARKSKVFADSRRMLK